MSDDDLSSSEAAAIAAAAAAATAPHAHHRHHHHDERRRYVMDIRIFMAVITIAMATSFTIGVAFGPKHQDYQFDPTKEILLLQQQQQQKLLEQEKYNRQMAETNNNSDPVEEENEPSGQHLLVDIRGVDSEFLDSEYRLKKAMEDTITAAQLTFLSYHCHKLLPSGVSCVGVLLESHISFHTWPSDGVITLDLLTCGTRPLLPVVKTIQELFGVNSDPSVKMQVQWSFELRGFHNGKDDKSILHLDHHSDLNQLILSPFDSIIKEVVVSTVTKYQRVDIWDIVCIDDSPSHEDAMAYNLQPGDPRWLTPEVVRPDRMFFLDGVLQSSRRFHHEYHEALVQPAMFTHPNPKHVAIVGGAEGATLREVLKHNTIESVTLIEIDQELYDILREHMPEYTDCSDFVGRANDCFDDEKVSLVFEDAKTWFLERFGSNPTKPSPKEPLLFDVVIFDAMDPEASSGFSQDLYYDPLIVEAAIKSLSTDGILAVQIGKAPTTYDPKPDIGMHKNREKLINSLEALDDVKAIFVYEDPHCGFEFPKSFLVACKDVNCRSKWYAGSEVIDFNIFERIVKTHSRNAALKYYDGVTHIGYQSTPKAWEVVYCRREPTPFECAYTQLDFDRQVHEYNVNDDDDDVGQGSSFTIDGSINEDHNKVTETFVYANVDIPMGSYIMPSHLASSFILTNETLSGLRGNMQYDAPVIKDFVNFIDTYGHHSNTPGSGLTIVEIGASYLMRSVDSEEKANVGRWIPPHPQGKRPKFSPVYDRHRLSFDVFMVATKDIAKGTELLKFSGMWDQE